MGECNKNRNYTLDEKVLPDGDRLDLLLETKDGNLIVAELKGPNKVSDEIPTQIASYVKDIQKEYPGREVRKIINGLTNNPSDLIGTTDWYDIGKDEFLSFIFNQRDENLYWKGTTIFTLHL